MRACFLLALTAATVMAADVCPQPKPQTGERQSWTAKIGSRECRGRAVVGNAGVEWPDAGIVQAALAGRLEFAVCCFSQSADKDDDDFPDLIDDDARTRSVSIRGTLGDTAHPARVDLLLKCSASKFADQFAFQFVIVNRSADRIEIVWDRLRELESRTAPLVQSVPGGKAFVFLTRTPPRGAKSAVVLKSADGSVLGRFVFDGFAASE
jgi:hypothetical protein